MKRIYWEKAGPNFKVNIDCCNLEAISNIDDEFFSANSYAHGKDKFSKIIDVRKLKGMKVLDIGAGFGSLASLMEKFGADVTALDFSSRCAVFLRKRKELEGSNMSVLECDATDIPLEDNSFDLIVSIGTIHHIPDYRKVIDNIYRLLKPNGKCIVMLYHKSSISYYYHKIIKHGIFGIGLLRLSADEVVRKYSEDPNEGTGFYSHFFKKGEVLELFGRFKDKDVKIYGHPIELEAIPFGGLKLGKLVPEGLRDKILSKYGWFMYIQATK